MCLNLIDNAPTSLDTLNTLAHALADGANLGTTIQNQLLLKTSTTYADNQLALQTNELTTYTKTTIYTALGLKTSISNMTTALALTANITYVEKQPTLKPKQLTTYTKSEVSDILTPNATVSVMPCPLYHFLLNCSLRHFLR